MGANLALTMAEKDFVIAVFNRIWAAIETLLAGAGPLAKRIIACRTLADRAAAVRPPRPVFIMASVRCRRAFKVGWKSTFPWSAPSLLKNTVAR